MEIEQVKEVSQVIEMFLSDHDIAGRITESCQETEWIDFKAVIDDERQMKRINDWLTDELKRAIAGYSDIEIAAPMPVLGMEQVLRVRVYESTV